MTDFDLDQLGATLIGDARLLALFATGSHAEGRADAHSDFDLLAVTDDADVQTFAADVPALIEGVELVVDAASRPLGPSVLVNLMTAQCQRVDVLVVGATAVREAPRFGSVKPIHDPDQIEATLPPASEPFAIQHGEDWFDSLVRGFLRTLVLLPMINEREEFIRGAQHVQLLKQDYLGLLLFDVGDPPLTRPGMWEWSELTRRLSADSRNRVQALAPAVMTREGVIQGHLDVADAFLAAGRRISEQAGFGWKHAAYESAVFDYLERSGFTHPAAS